MPPARREDVVDVLHGTRVADPYRWLEDGEDADTATWVAAQNERTRQALDARPDRGRWHERLVALMRQAQAGSPIRRGERLFLLERPADAEQFRLVVRSALDPSGPPRLLVDPAAGRDDPAAAVDWYRPSLDGSLVAYGVSEGGTENSVLRVLRVADGEHLGDEIPNCRAASVAWLPDASGFWYTRYPDGDEYNRAVWFHLLGTSVAEDELVWHDAERKETWPDVRSSPDGRHVLVHAMKGWSHVDVHLFDTASGTWTEVITGVEATTSFAFGGDGLVGVTTHGAPRGRVVTVALDRPQPGEWRTLVEERSLVAGSFAITRDELVCVFTDVAVDLVERRALTDGALLGTIDGLGVASIAVSGDCDEPGVFCTVTGFSEPMAVWSWEPDHGLRRWAPEPDEAAAEIPDLTVTYRSYPSLDGTPVGIFLIHRSDVRPGPTTPAILTGYGGFAIAETPAWSPMAATWCDAGGLYAIAGLRGGFEHGEEWHQAGRRDRKQNVFDDFHAAAEWLVAQDLTAYDRLGIAGGSNGGLLVGAALTQRPQSYRAVWCAVPLLDMVRYPQFLIARLWTDEYGDPEVPEEFEWLWRYSPYHHVQAERVYPAVFLTTGEGDTRVDPCHARKMAAALQWAAAAQEERPILFHQKGLAGHGAGMPVSIRAGESADVLTFFAWQLQG